MAGTVTSQLTNITLAEAADSANWDDIGGGPGSANLGDLPVQGTEHRGRRIDNITTRGFGFDNGTAIDLSGTGEHLAFWINVLQPAQINTVIELSISDSAADSQTGNWDGHQFQGSDYPFQGGWIRVFVDVSRTRDAGSGTLNLATGPRNFGARFPMGDVGGTTPNCNLDRIDYTTTGLLVDSGTVPSPATFADFDTADGGNTSNRYGVVLVIGGKYFVNARLTIGDATATIFNDSPSIVFADQPLAASDFQGLTIDLQNASTTVDLTGGTIESAPGGTNEGDLVVTGTSGSFDAAGVQCARLRVVTLTNACSMTGGGFSACGLITAAGADLSGSTVSNSTASASILWNVATDTDGLLDSIAFESDGSNHAIELGSNTPATIDLTGQTFTGYATVDGSTGNEVIYNNSGKAITINVSGVTGTVSVRDGAGASTTLVIDPVTLTVTAEDLDNGNAAIEGAAVLALAETGGDLPFEDTVTITRSGSTATVAHTAHGIGNGKKVLIEGADQEAYNGIHTITVTGVNAYTFTVSGTPTTPATGTILATAVIIDALTNVSGQASDTRSYSQAQPFSGTVRKASFSPVYDEAPISGDIDNTAGFSITAPMSRDE